MHVWRVSRYAALDGAGGLWAPGRWHSQGRRVIYCSEHQATAQLEWLVHLEVEPKDFPVTIPFFEIEVPDDVRVDSVQREFLTEGWERDDVATRSVGDDWLVSGSSALLSVPSVLVPAQNVLINPMHPDAHRMSIVRKFDFHFDDRLR